MRTIKDEWITVSDGVRICADVYLPEGDGPFPALYAVAPYQKDLLHLPAVSMFRFIETGPLDYWTGHGYAVVVGDQRGTGRSEGQFELFGPAEQRDFYDTIEWIASRPWSTGKVSMIGESAYSVNQWLAAAQRPPHLTCALIYSGFTDLYHDAVYHGGVYSMGFLNFWSTDHLRASATIGGGTPPRPGGVTADLIGMTLDRPVFDDWWEQRAVKVEDIDVPVLNIAWWYSVGLHLRGQLDGYERLRDPDKRLVVLAGTDSHESYYRPDFLDAHIRPWYDHWLKGVDNGVMDGPAVRIQVANSGRRPREESEWPPRRAVPITLYLDPEPAHAVPSLNDGSLATTPPTGPAGTATVYDYPNPEWTVGTTVITDGIPQPTRGVLTFTTAPLEHDTEVTGKITLVLYAESDQTDTDFHVKLSEQKAVPKLKQTLMRRIAKNVPPPSATVTRGWLKASHRTHPPQPIEPGTVVRYEIEVWPTSYLFPKGSRIRLEIAGGDSAVADGLFHHYYGHKAGRDLIHHDADHPSHLVLPVIRQPADSDNGASTVATTSSSPRPSARHLTGTPGRAARPAAIGIGLLANLVYVLVLTGVAGYGLKAPAAFGRPAQIVQIGVVIAASVVPALLGWGLLELLERFVPRRATLIWSTLATLLLVGGLPYNGAGVTATDQFLLALMHLVVGAAVIPAFVITSLRRS